jgi:hypothetical protein
MGWKGRRNGALTACVLGVLSFTVAAHSEDPAGDRLPPRQSGIEEVFILFGAVDWAEFDRLRTGLDPDRIELDTTGSDSTDDFTFAAWLHEQQPRIFDFEQLLRPPISQWPARCESCPVVDPRDANISKWMRSFSTLLTFDGQRCAAEDDWDGWAHRVALQARLAAALLAQEDHMLPASGWAILERISTALTTVSRLGYGHRFSPRGTQEIQAALSLIESDDPGRFRRRWWQMIEPRLASFQQAIRAGDPSEAYTRLAREHLSPLNALFADIPFNVESPEGPLRFREITLARVATIPDEQVLHGVQQADDLSRRIAAALEKGDADAIRATAAEADQDPSGVVRLLWELPPRSYWDFCERVRAAHRQAVDAAASIAREQ